MYLKHNIVLFMKECDEEYFSVKVQKDFEIMSRVLENLIEKG